MVHEARILVSPLTYATSLTRLSTFQIFEVFGHEIVINVSKKYLLATFMFKEKSECFYIVTIIVIINCLCLFLGSITTVLDKQSHESTAYPSVVFVSKQSTLFSWVCNPRLQQMQF